ncbi:K02A2.6-like [Cordylochernes scorpioides]|uniref:K02A2.6-like n=1 Tax=Cordylochernes scorpioides TaxID=51811 RepID=A0ABY6KNL9_9ARAC|nr:K02A2.6-like [Cordylochernes scorpioides]
MTSKKDLKTLQKEEVVTGAKIDISIKEILPIFNPDTGLTYQEWRNLFERIVKLQSISEKDALSMIPSIFKEKALEIYASMCQDVFTLDELHQAMNTFFSVSTSGLMKQFWTEKKLPSQPLMDYYFNKLKLAKILNIRSEQTLEALSSNVNAKLRPFLIAANPANLDMWIKIASSLEEGFRHEETSSPFNGPRYRRDFQNIDSRNATPSQDSLPSGAHPAERLATDKKPGESSFTKTFERSFEALKEALVSKPILQIYNPLLATHIFCDASIAGLGGVLKQEYPDGTLRPIAFYSRALRGAESKYTITELELLAIIETCKRYHPYISGQHVIVHTDHKALIWLNNFKHTNGRLFRWALKLSEYDLEFKYNKGCENHEADMLSRLPYTCFLTVQNIEQEQKSLLKPSSKLYFIKNERANATIISKLRLHHQQNSRIPWPKLLQKALEEYRSIPHSITKMPPVYLLFGITPSYINNLTRAYPPIEEARRIANENTEKLHLKLVKRYNESHKTPNLKIGDKVLYKIPYQSGQGKLMPAFYPEPYTIISIPSPQTIEIDKPCQPENKHATIVNISKVKLWDPVTEDNTEPPFPFQEEEDLEGCLGVEPNKQASTDSPQKKYSSAKPQQTRSWSRSTLNPCTPHQLILSSTEEFLRENQVDQITVRKVTGQYDDVECVLAMCLLHDDAKHGYGHHGDANRTWIRRKTQRHSILAFSFIVNHTIESATLCDVELRSASQCFIQGHDGLFSCQVVLIQPPAVGLPGLSMRWLQDVKGFLLTSYEDPCECPCELFVQMCRTVWPSLFDLGFLFRGLSDRVIQYQTFNYVYSDHRAVLIQVGDPAPTRLPCIGKLLQIKADLVAEIRSLAPAVAESGDRYIERASLFLRRRLEDDTTSFDYSSLSDLGRSLRARRRSTSTFTDDDGNPIFKALQDHPAAENTRCRLGARHYTPLAVISLDLKSAFDTLSRRYLFALLEKLGLPSTFLVPSSFSTEGGKGCRLNVALFSIGVGPLIRRLGRILDRGFVVIFADDIVLFIRDHAQFEIVPLVFEGFRMASVGAVNLSKSCGLWYGSWKYRTDSPLNISWTTESLSVLHDHRRVPPHGAARAKNREMVSVYSQPVADELCPRGQQPGLGSILHHLHGYVSPETTIRQLQARFVWGTSRVSWFSGGILARTVFEGGVSLLGIAGQLRFACLKGVQASLRGAANGYFRLVRSLTWLISPSPDSWLHGDPHRYISWADLRRNCFSGHNEEVAEPQILEFPSCAAPTPGSAGLALRRRTPSRGNEVDKCGESYHLQVPSWY